MIFLNNKKYFSFFLIFVGVHSLLVGVSLLIIDPSFLQHFGFNNYTESFFQAQGGAFHIVMSIAYFMAGIKYEKSTELIIFIIMVKFIAFIFLISYFIIKENNLLILLSGIGDGLMGLIILLFFKLNNLK